MPNLPYSSVSNQAFGGVVLTINGTTFVARNFAPQKATRTIQRMDENGDEAAFMLRAEPTSQSGLTLQMANANVTPPFLGNTFSHSNVNYVVTAVSRSYPQGEFHLVDIDYRSESLPTD